MNVFRALLLVPLLLAAPLAQAAPRLTPEAGFAWLARSGTGAPVEASGVALSLRLADRPSPRAGWAVTLSWGLTDWDRAAEWIDAGNRAGSWTTDRFGDVEAWVRRGEDDDTVGPRLIGALFADTFLAMTYVAVPVCYVGSVGGATSHLQLDLTGALYLTDGGGAGDAWLELGAGAATLPVTGGDWTGVLGPVVGLGTRVGPVTLGGRFLWSPPSLNGGARGETVRTGAVTIGYAR